MSIFRKKPVVQARGYDSWEPAAIAAEHASDDARPTRGRSRNNAGHLKAAVDAIAAAKARDAK
jgi:hypothetical protein